MVIDNQPRAIRFLRSVSGQAAAIILISAIAGLWQPTAGLAQPSTTVTPTAEPLPSVTRGAMSVRRDTPQPRGTPTSESATSESPASAPRLRTETPLATPSATATSVPLPDLVVTEFSARGRTSAEPVELRISIRNRGTAGAGAYYLHLFAVWSAPPTTDNPPRHAVQAPPLREGESATITAEFPAGELVGESILLWVLADGRGTVAEADETNNTASTYVTVQLAATATPTMTRSAPASPAASTPIETPSPVPSREALTDLEVATIPNPPRLAPPAGPVSSTGVDAAQFTEPELRVENTPPPTRILPRRDWSEPVRISEGAGGWFPDVAADDRGTVHVVWDGGSKNQASWELQPAGAAPLPAPSGTATRESERLGALYYTSTAGQGWSKPVDLGLICCEHALRSSLAVDASGGLHVIRKGIGQLEPDIFADPFGLAREDLWHVRFDASVPKSMSSGSEPSKVSRGSQGYYSDVATDSQGTLHAIWTESSEGSWGIFYRSSVDGGETWSSRVALEESAAVWWYRAQLRIDDWDRLHVVWELTDPSLGRRSLEFGTTVGARYATSSDGGETWARVHLPSYDRPNGAEDGDVVAPGAQQPAIGVDGQGKILLVFREPSTDRIVYQVSTDGADWSSPATIPGIARGVARPYDVYDLVTDSRGQVHLAAVAYASGVNHLALLHLEWNGQAWGEADLVSNSAGFPEYPRLALSNGNQLHVVWFEGDRDSIDRTPLGIFYSTALTTAPEQASRAVAESTDPAAASASGQAQSAATPPNGMESDSLSTDLGATWKPTPERQPSFVLAIAGLLVSISAIIVLAKLELVPRLHMPIRGR